MRLVLQDWKDRAVIGGRKFSNFHFADDAILIAKSTEELEQLLDKLEEVSSDYD